MSDALEGGCRCRAIRYRVKGDPIVVAVCHCSMCRHAHSAPAVTWAMYNEEQVVFTELAPAIYQSSPDAERGYCPDCGTPLCFAASYIPGLIDIAVGSFDRPEALVPTLHYWYSARLPWVSFDDGLPKHAEFPPLGE
jgi:hypothetical protein